MTIRTRLLLLVAAPLAVALVHHAHGTWSAVGLALLVTAAGLMVGRSILHPLDRLLRHLRGIEESGDLGRRLHSRRTDEIGELARAIDSLVSSLQESQARRDAVLENAVDAIITIDEQGRVRSFNRAATEIFGLPADQAIGQGVTRLIPPELRDPHREGLSRYLQTGEGNVIGRSVEVEGLRRDGSRVPLELTISEVALRDRRLFTAIARDVTERQQAGRELIRTKEAAEAASQAKSRFLANMSHEIRTPMNGVMGMTELLLDTGLDAEQREYAETVHQSARALLAIIDDILDLSKVEAGKLELEVIDFDLQQMLDDLSDLLALRAAAKGLEYLCTVRPEVPSLLRGDPGRLRQVLFNLVGNAVKFTEEGEVLLEVILEQEQEREAKLRFEVADTGIGIPKERQERLFQPFSQADASTTRRFGGTGLGLSISRELAARMGGEIGVESTEGEGATFWFTARLGKQEPFPASGPQIQSADLSGERILVVDDSPTNRRWLEILLRSWGCRPEEAPDGASALEKLRGAVRESDPFGLALLDMQMPGMDGEALGRRIKQDPELQHTPLVMLTSVGRRGDAARLGAVGFAAYLNKPVKQAVLGGCLEEVLRGRPRPARNQRPAVITRFSVGEARKQAVRILVAEDNPVNQKLALKLLEKLGYRAGAVASGAEAIRALAREPYDLVLMDCQMPEMDGYQATRVIRDPDSPVLDHRVPVIAVTANAMHGDRQRCLEAGMDDHIPKPIERQLLAGALERWLREAPARQPGPPEPAP